MLALSRKAREAVILTLPDGRTVRVVVSDFGRGKYGGFKVRLAFDAPPDVRIMREELIGRAEEGAAS